MAVSNNITAILNFVAMMCSIPIMAAGIWLGSNECIHWLRWPLVFLGLAFLLVSLTGFAGAYWKKGGLLALYLLTMFILILLLLLLLVLAFVLTRPTGAYPVPATGFKEYRLDGFSSLLRNLVVGDENWGKIRVCLSDSQICPKLTDTFISAPEFFAAHLSPIQSGCCKPPLICGFQYSNPTTWLKPSNTAAGADCGIWNNEATQLCYDCESCKAGVLGELRAEWRKANILLIITVVLLIWVYLIACSAYKNAQTEQLFRRYKQGWV